MDSCVYKSSKEKKIFMVVVYTRNHETFRYEYFDRPSAMNDAATKRAEEGFTVWGEWWLEGSDTYYKSDYCHECKTLHMSRGTPVQRKKL